MGALANVWKSTSVSTETKVKLYLAIPVNLALWNAETWSRNAGDLKLLDTFHHKSIRRILGINMSMVKDDHIKNEQVRTLFGNIDLLSTIWRKRLLNFIGRASRNSPSALSSQCLSCHIHGQRIRGRPFRTYKDAMIESLCLLIPSMPNNGNYKYWQGYTQDKPK